MTDELEYWPDMELEEQCATTSQQQSEPEPQQEFDQGLDLEDEPLLGVNNGFKHPRFYLAEGFPSSPIVSSSPVIGQVQLGFCYV